VLFRSCFMSDRDIIHGPRRLHHLDSLRGIAALGVAFQHSWACFEFGKTKDYIYSLFGLSPVVFFFLLSGFVLSKSLDAEKGRTFSGVIGCYIRRIFRLYPAALVSMLISALIAFLALPSTDWSLFSDWLGDLVSIMDRPVSSEGYLGSVSLFRETCVFNPGIFLFLPPAFADPIADPISFSGSADGSRFGVDAMESRLPSDRQFYVPFLSRLYDL